MRSSKGSTKNWTTRKHLRLQDYRLHLGSILKWRKSTRAGRKAEEKRMTKDSVQEIWNAYLDAYADVSKEERKRLLAESVSDDVLSTNPGDETQGFENLVAHVEQFQHRLPGSYFKINSL